MQCAVLTSGKKQFATKVSLITLTVDVHNGSHSAWMFVFCQMLFFGASRFDM